jgi:phosphoribosylaminoimidazole-succinocarboxamide synthase
MALTKQKLLYSGKAKNLYTTEQADLLIVEFRDDTTAFNGEKLEQLAEKGRVNNQISTYIMQQLMAAGVKTHFVEYLSPTEVVVKRLKMIPLESVIRNMAAGSLCRRLGIEAGLAIDPPLFELFLKSDALGDPMINRHHAVAFNWATDEQIDKIHTISLQINQVLKAIFVKAGMTLVDSKYEFGVDEAGGIYLADEISPDSCRIWDAETKEILDKDRFRQDMGSVVESYKVIAQKLGL